MTIARRYRVIAAVAVVGLVGAAAYCLPRYWLSTIKTTVTAYFPNSNGIYVGDDVRILGVKVGSIGKIEPHPDAVKITFSFDSKYAVPADAKAAVLSPSLVTARAIQLVPAYTGGPKLADHAVIPRERTAVPVEYDDFREQLQALTDELLPKSDDLRSPFGAFIDTAAANLRGEGANARDTFIKLARAMSALGDHSTDIFSTVRNLQLLVTGLRASSELLADFNVNFAGITSALSNTPDEVARATSSLDAAIADLRGFVAENREATGVAFDHLGAITTALNETRGDLKQLLHAGPTNMQNFMNIYSSAQMSQLGVLAINNFANPIQFICGLIQAASREGAEKSAKLCVQYLAPIIKNRQYNFPPIGTTAGLAFPFPVVGPKARPNEITYSEDRLRPDFAPPPGEVAPPTPPPADGFAADASDLEQVPPPPAVPTVTDPARGLPGMMIPGGTP